MGATRLPASRMLASAWTGGVGGGGGAFGLGMRKVIYGSLMQGLHVLGRKGVVVSGNRRRFLHHLRRRRNVCLEHGVGEGTGEGIGYVWGGDLAFPHVLLALELDFLPPIQSVVRA